MADTIVDSKFRLLEPLTRLGGRPRHLVSDLISSRVGVLETVALEGFDRVLERWGDLWQPALRERAARFAAREGFVPVTAVGAWSEGPYYVYDAIGDPDELGQTPDHLPNAEAVARLLEDLAAVNASGDHVLNLRPEQLVVRGGRLLILPGAYILPLELLVRTGARSPYQPPELRHAGLVGPGTDGYELGSVFAAVAERVPGPPPEWLARMSGLLALEPWLRPSPLAAAQALRGGEPVARLEATRRGVERLLDLRQPAGESSIVPSRVLEALDAALAQLAEGKSSALLIEGPANGAGLAELFIELRQQISFLSERPRVLEIEPLASWDLRDLAGGGLVLLVPDWRPSEPELLPLDSLLQEKLRPAIVVVGVRASLEVTAGTETVSPAEWVRRRAGSEVQIRSTRSDAVPPAPLATPESAAARHLLDLLCVLEADATAGMLRQALPQQEPLLPQAIVELERLGWVRRQLDAGGWWGTEARLVLRALRADALAERRAALPPERREELHLLISHLLEGTGVRSIGQRFLRVHHLFAGGNWEVAAAECEALLKGVQRRGLDALLRQIQRKIVGSNLAHHFTLVRLLDLLRNLGQWEVEHGRVAEGQRYYERAAERLFALTDSETASLDLEGVTETMLEHADLLERRVGFARALELVQRYLDRFGERLPALDRGRLFAELAYCEMRLGRFTAAEERCQIALKLLDPRRNPKDVAQVYNVLGTVRWKTSRYEEAEQYFSTCLALREKTGDKLAVARIYNNLGLLYRTMRRYPEALEHHEKSMQIRQELGDAEGVARCVVNLGWVHFRMTDLERAEELGRRACAASDDLGILAIRAQAKGLLGEIYMARGRTPEARQTLEEAVQGMRELGDLGELFSNLHKLASLELRCGRHDAAETLLQEAERFLSSAASPLEEASWHLTWADLHRAQGDPRRAAVAYEHAGNNLARLGNAPSAAEMFLRAAEEFHASGVDARGRDLVERARQLYSRDPAAVLPRGLLDLEVQLGAAEGPERGVPQAERLVDVLCRAVATAATSGSDAHAVEQLLGELRTLSGARHVVLLGRDQLPHRASLIARGSGDEPPYLLDNPQLVVRALQTLLPFGSDDAREEPAPRPFLVLPVESRERSLGCIYLEWQAEERTPEPGIVTVLRALVQQTAVVLERMEPATASRPQSLPELPPVAPAAASLDESGLETIIGRSAARQAVIDFVRQVRDLEATVLIMGENGTGKEVVSRAIHSTGVRRNYPFVSINCTAIPEALWERELFGHERGAFTDAFETKRGFFESAHRGTLLLDEIGDMPWEMQTKFLRVLEEKSFTRIGGTTPTHVDVRIIAATNQELEAAVQAGRFRRDLYHRLNVLSITLRPLRERREDIPELARYFLDHHASLMGVRPKRLSGEALRILMRYPWPGTVRELENAMKGSLVLSDREVLLPEDLPAAVLRGGDAAETVGELDLDSVAKWVLDHAAYSTRVPLMPAIEKALARQLVAKLGEKTMAARLLGISKPTLYTRLK